MAQHFIDLDFPEDFVAAAERAGIKMTVHPESCGGECPECSMVIKAFARSIAKEEDRAILEIMRKK